MLMIRIMIMLKIDLRWKNSHDSIEIYDETIHMRCSNNLCLAITRSENKLRRIMTLIWNVERNGLRYLVEHVAFDLTLCGSIPAIFLRSNCWVRLPYTLPSRTVLPSVQEIVCCPPTSSLCRLPRRSEFPLTLQLRQSSFVKGGWGLT
jgi:hypothetical protein